MPQATLLVTLLILTLGPGPTTGLAQCTSVAHRQARTVWVPTGGFTICAPGFFTADTSSVPEFWADTSDLARGALPWFEVWVSPTQAELALGYGIDSLRQAGWDCRADCAEYHDVQMSDDVIGGSPVTLQSALLSGTFGHFDSVPVLRIARRRAGKGWVVVTLQGRSQQQRNDLLTMARSIRWDR